MLVIEKKGEELHTVLNENTLQNIALKNTKGNNT